MYCVKENIGLYFKIQSTFLLLTLNCFRVFDMRIGKFMLEPILFLLFEISDFKYFLIMSNISALTVYFIYLIF